MQFTENYSPMDFDYDDPNDEPVCVCADYEGAVHPVFCKACNMWTDDAELLAAEATDDIPTPVLIETPVYQFTAPEFFSKEKEQAA